MIHKVTANNQIDGRGCSLTYTEVNTCPVCKSKISPKYLFSTVFDKDNNHYAEILSFCTGCSSSFISRYDAKSNGGNVSQINLETDVLLFSVPNGIEVHEFDDKIAQLSPQFVKIYNQASAAESHNLDEIAGLGYRKSLEFLIKDFAISEHPENEDKIKSAPLSQCIKNYIDYPRIKTLAEKSAWIGNDEAHYIRKQENRDITDMKEFIKAAVFFISMVQITKDAESIESK